MEDVEVVLETDGVGVDLFGVIDGGDDPAPFFLRGESLYYHVPFVRQQQFLRIWAGDQCL
jgi:hypothetical protein